ncbi:MAG: hypothetical protein ACREC5_07620, partial [Thermoplasmata archaeon]
PEGWATGAGSSASPWQAETSGAFYAGPSTARLTLAAPANGSENVTGAGHLVIAAPLLATSKLLRGEPTVYAASAAAAALLAGGAIAVYRRHDRRLRESL